MTGDFEKLPLIGIHLDRLSLRPERFLLLSFIGVLPYQGARHAIYEFTLQFNRCAVIELDIDTIDDLAVQSLSTQEVARDAITGDRPRRITSLESTLRQFHVGLAQGAIDVIANDFTFSMVREDPFSDDDERRYRRSAG